jgi:hypothetical protein
MEPLFWLYDSEVRLIFVLILMALLPLRSWSGDAMAVHMTLQVTSHSQGLAMAQAMEHANCDDGGESEGSAVCEHCVFCQACFSPAIAVPETQLLQQQPTAIAPALNAVDYASAELAFRSKPPIS